MDTSSELAAWMREWQEILEDMGGRELLVVLEQLADECSRRRWLTDRYDTLWLRLTHRLLEKIGERALEAHDPTDDVPF